MEINGKKDIIYHLRLKNIVQKVKVQEHFSIKDVIQIAGENMQIVKTVDGMVVLLLKKHVICKKHQIK
jgi:hypothetical protein